MSDEGRRGVSARFEELDWQRTSMGEISLRRRWDPVAEKEAYEIKLDDEFLMSSLFTISEVKLAELALAGGSGIPQDGGRRARSGIQRPGGSRPSRRALAGRGRDAG